MPQKAPRYRSVRSTRVNVKPNSNSVDPKKEATDPTGRLRKRVRKVRKEDTEDRSEESVSESEADEETKRTKKRANAAKAKTKAQYKPKIKSSTTVPRPAGSPFPDAISPDTLEFMQELAENNDREWMLVNNDRWHATKKDFTDFVGLAMKELKEIDTTILDVEPKEALFRLNRDLRFTNDLSPYKTYLSAAFSRGGKKTPFAAYYISICPGDKSYLGGGVWHPTSPILTRIRNEIDQDPTLLYQALELAEVEAFFGKKGLAVLEEGEKLKTAPKGFPKDHREIELLRYKSFVVGKGLTDEEVVGKGFLDKVVQGLEAIVPFVTVLNGWTG